MDIWFSAIKIELIYSLQWLTFRKERTIRKVMGGGWEIQTKTEKNAREGDRKQTNHGKKKWRMSGLQTVPVWKAPWQPRYAAVLISWSWWKPEDSRSDFTTDMYKWRLWTKMRTPAGKINDGQTSYSKRIMEVLTQLKFSIGCFNLF